MQHLLFEDRIPGIAEYNALKVSVGWPVLEDKPTIEGLNNSLYAVCVIQNESVIGTGRIVGDGGIYFHLQDVIVHPDEQGKGIGTKIIEKLMNYIVVHAAPNAMVGLMCAKGVDPLYKKFGFVSRPNEIYGPGMMQLVKHPS